jgi:hypothetical protein
MGYVPGGGPCGAPHHGVRCRRGGGTPSQSSVVGTGSGHFIETGGPFELSVTARGEGALADGHVRRFRRSEGPGAPAQDGGVQVYIEDNGKPRNGQPVDRVATEPPHHHPPPSTPPPGCAPIRR